MRYILLMGLAFWMVVLNRVSSSEIQTKNCPCVFVERPTAFCQGMEVAGCFCEHDGKVLFLLRNPEKPQGNTWCVPGGKLEKDECPIEAVIREVQEETGLILPKENLHYCRAVFIRFPNSEFILHLFRIHLNEFPDLLLNTREHSDYCWVTYEEALCLPLIPGGEECLRLAFEKK
jgi:8-oxo-dGTP diphosphatase